MRGNLNMLGFLGVERGHIKIPNGRQDSVCQSLAEPAPSEDVLDSV